MSLTKVTYSMINGSVANVLDYGAVRDGVTDDTAAIQAAIDGNPGKIIFMPRGTYVSSGVSILTNGTKLVGEGMSFGGTIIRPSNTTGNDITLIGQQSGVYSILIQPNVKKTDGYGVYVTDDAFRCVVESVSVIQGFNGIAIVNGTQTRIENCQVRYLLGVHGIYFGGTNTGGYVGSYRAMINNFEADNPYPFSPQIAAVKTWASSTAFLQGDIVNVNGVIWQCSTAGTTGATSPSGYPGATAQAVFSQPVADGTAAWRFVCLDTLFWIVQDSYSYSLVINEAALLHGARGFAQIDSAATGTSYPVWCYAWDLECDHNFLGGVTQFAGENIVLNGSWLGSTLNGNGFTAGPSGRGEIYIGAGTRIMGCAFNGVSINAGPTAIIIDGCFIGVNSNAAAAVYHGISVQANASKFQITNNKIGTLPATAGNLQAYGVFIAVGTSNEYVVTNNNLIGNATGGMLDNGTGATRVLSNNIGFVSQSQGISAVTTGNSSVVVNHSLSKQPAASGITITNSSPFVGDSFYLDTTSVTATQFTVRTNSAVASDQFFVWTARISNS